jgi:sodium-coupled neutral amino acid transporter 11
MRIQGLPYAVREAGFFTGIFLLVVLGIVTDWTIRLCEAIHIVFWLRLMIMIIRSVVLNAKLTGKKSYIDIMESCFGFPGRAVVSFFQFSFAFGGMCAFAVILGDTIPRKCLYHHLVTH